ncbi:tyrosine-type recombinase/integrase [Peribacillus frigoritolerans]|uniref:site-specific integrase n=1 Tax=Peribacillus frigoritolerans TaxID=450367 RepID=UPI0038192E00
MASFRKRGEHWEYRIKYKDPFTQSKKEKMKGGFKTKKEAQLAAREMEIHLGEGLEQKPILLKTFLNEWLHEYKKGSVRKNTFVLHEVNIRNHILPYFKDILLSDVKPVMYQKFLNNIHEAGYSRRTVEIIHSTMSNAMSKAVTIGKIQKNPCIGVTIKGKQKEKGIKYLESDQIPLFLQTAHQYGYNYWIFFRLLIETGMRKGEAAALQWTDIDLKEQTISISKTLNFTAKSKQDLFGDTKTFNSKRVISISQTLTQVLQHHLRHQNQHKLALNDLYHHDLNLVLCRDDGSFMPKSTLFNAFSRILKRAELPSLPIHSLRHTHAVLQLEAGADMKYVQKRLGHGSVAITSDVYAHISKKLEKKNIDKFEEYTKGIID